MPHIIKLFGGPGTGKTSSVLKDMEKKIASGIPLEEIAYLSFSTTAREEAVDRCRAMIPGLSKDSPKLEWFRTIHGACFRERSLQHDQTMVTKDWLQFGKDWSIKFSDDFNDTIMPDGLPRGWGQSKGNQLINIIQYASARCIDLYSDECRKVWPVEFHDKWVELMVKRLEAWLKDNNKITFSGQLERYDKEGKPLPIRVLYLDEAQDLSQRQWRVVHKMWSECDEAYMAGDDDQSIYSFIGADPQGFYHHPCDEKIILTRTWRLPAPIWEYAKKIISEVKEREVKDIVPGDHPGDIRWVNQTVQDFLDEHISKMTDVLVVAPNNHYLYTLKKHLEGRGVNYVFKDEAITGTRTAKIFHAYHRMFFLKEMIPAKKAAQVLTLFNPQEAAKMRDRGRRAKELVGKDEMMKHGVEEKNGDDSCDYLVRSKFAGKDASRNRACLHMIRRNKAIDSILEPPTVRLTTIHNAKGREADTVLFITDCSRATRESFDEKPDDERRLAYVAITRAKRALYIFRSRENNYIKVVQDAVE